MSDQIVELYHYGVKGMKWGRKKSRSGRAAAKLSRRNEVKSLSDQELRARISRIQMERQYLQLTQPPVSKGKKIAQELVTNAAKQMAAEAVKNGMTLAVKSAINATKKLGKKD